MKYFKELCLVEILYVLFYISEADAIKCYQCDSLDPGCTTLTKKDVESPYYKECSGRPNPFCRKTTQTLLFDAEEEVVRIARSCGWLRRTNDTKCFREGDTDFKFDRNCQCFEDGCNSAPAANYFSGFLLIVATAVAACNKFSN